MEHLKDMAARTKHARESNQGKEIKVGDNVIDIYCHTGTVTKVVKPKRLSADDHGIIHIRKLDGLTAHYTYWRWTEMLKIT